MTFDDEQRQLESVKREFLREYADRLSPEDVTTRFDAIVAGFEGAPVRTFVPVLARRMLRQQLAGTG